MGLGPRGRAPHQRQHSPPNTHIYIQRYWLSAHTHTHTERCFHTTSSMRVDTHTHTLTSQYQSCSVFLNSNVQLSNHIQCKPELYSTAVSLLHTHTHTHTHTFKGWNCEKVYLYAGTFVSEVFLCVSVT